MNKFMKKITNLFTPKKDTATALGSDDTVDLLEVLRKPSRATTYPRLAGNDPKSKCRGTKKGATHYVRKAGEGLSS